MATPRPNRPKSAHAHAGASSGGAAAAKALLFVVLGGALAAVGMFAIGNMGSSDSDEADGGAVRASPDAKETTPGPEATPAAEADGGDAKAEPEPEPAAADDAGEPGGSSGGDAGGDGDEPTIVVDDEPAPPPAPTTAADLAAQAQAALDEAHWSDPVEGSLAMSLQHLSLLDPSHEAVGRLRREAAKVLLPQAEEAAEAKQWSQAADAYRDLVQVWPGHPTAKEELVEALRNQGRVLARHDDHLSTLATADEWLNYAPDELDALLLRANALLDLERYDEAKEAFKAARNIKPRDKRVKKGLKAASRLAKKDEG